MKRIILILLLLLAFVSPVYADTEFYIQGENEYNKNVQSIMSGDFYLDPAEILKKTLNMFYSEVKNSKKLIINLLVISAMSGTLNTLQLSFGNSQSGEAAFLTCFTLIAITLSSLISQVVGYGAEVIKNLTDFTTKIAPVLTISLIASGKVASAGSFYPVLSGAIYVVSVVIDRFIIPMVYLSAILGIVNNISRRVQLKNLTNLIKNFSKWILTGTLTVFTGINAIYGFSVPVLDAVSLKALQFTVGSCVPVVGGLVSDTVETVITGAKLMKSAVGTAGIITVISICTVPILKLGAIILLLKFAAAAAEPLTDKRISGMITDIIAPITTVFSMVIATSMLFIISIAIIIGAN